MRKKQVNFIVLLCIYFLLAIGACKKDEESRLIRTNKDVYAIMNHYYLWYEYVPSVDPTLYGSSEALLDDLIYKPLDRWSFITTKTEFDAYFEAGEYIGHGFSRKIDKDNTLRIAFIYKDSDLYPRGVRRGWKIISVNGVLVNGDYDPNELYGPNEAGVENIFVFEDLEGESREFSSIKKEISINSVLHSDVIQMTGEKVGHIVYEGFINPSVAELDTAFTKFKNEEIDDLILDLRYNGGGSTLVAQHLASLIAGNIAENEVLMKYTHNDKLADQFDTVMRIERLPISVTIDNLVVIATRGTASASEVIINGLEPFMNVVVIGDDTHGKPVGMYVFEDKKLDYAFAPVCFKNTNANDYGNYFDGILADAYVEDDVTHDFSDVEELCLKQAFYYLENGSFDATIKSSFIPTGIKKESITGRKFLIAGRRNLE